MWQVRLASNSSVRSSSCNLRQHFFRQPFVNPPRRSQQQHHLSENPMPYDPMLVQPMREELTAIGIAEMRTAADVDAALTAPGTTLVVVNSVCGCAAGGARPGVAKAMQHTVLPDRTVTVFAGQDLEATERARTYFTGMPPSSPCFALLRDGNLVAFMPRHHIEGRSPDMIAAALTSAFDNVCAPSAA